MKRHVIRVEPTRHLARQLQGGHLHGRSPRRHDLRHPGAAVPAWNGGFDIEVDCIAAV